MSCFWKYDAGQEGEISPSTMSLTTSALLSPHAIMMTLLALIIVEMPRVMADFGVTEISPLKNLDWIFLLLYERATVWVRLVSRAPTSLNPTCPCSPIPMTSRSIPLADFSNSEQ